EKGYVVGFNEMFNPNDPISRQDIAVIINRVILDKNVDIMLGEKKSFTDADDISDYAIKAVENMQAVAIINGYEDGTFKPNDNATRAESAKMMYLVQNIIK
ncbi:MAG: S-layer homology domain-containing protein, partial [Oscillospiraceae bacterium]